MYYENFLSRFTDLPIAYYASKRSKADMDSSLWYGCHLHQEFEILYLETGDGVVTVNKKPISMKSGDVILIPPFVAHEAVANYDTPLSEYCICFDLALLRTLDPMFATVKIDEQTLCGILNANDPVTTEVVSHLLHIIRACQEHPIGWTAAARGHLLLLFSLLLEKFPLLPSVAPARDEDFYRNVVDYINEHYQSAITSRIVSESLNYSQSYFCRRFKRDFGMCFNEYLNTYRLSKARALLAKEKHTVAEAAAQVGFSSPSYFTQCFQKQFGMLPSDYVNR